MAPDPVFQFDFTKSRPGPERIRREGGAMYPNPTDNNCLRLTKTVTDPDGSIYIETNNWGRAISTKRVPFSKETTFQTTIKFTVTPKAINAAPADGLVFYMAPYGQEFPQNPCNGNFGIFDPESGKAPKVFAMKFNTSRDPDFSPHLGFDMGSRSSDVTNYVADPSYIGHQVTLTIKYAGKKITAMIKTDSHPGYTMTYSYDLSKLLIEVNTVEVGLGASTGDHVALHDVFYWDFFVSPPPN